VRASSCCRSFLGAEIGVFLRDCGVGGDGGQTTEVDVVAPAEEAEQRKEEEAGETHGGWNGKGRMDEEGSGGR